jgi:hypothetical protein
MKRLRPQNLSATVFIFERKSKPFTTHAVYIDQASYYTNHPEWNHVATIEPAMWIENLLNNPKSREQNIESLCHK